MKVVVSGPADELVVARSADETVVAASAIEKVIAIAADEAVCQDVSADIDGTVGIQFVDCRPDQFGNVCLVIPAAVWEKMYVVFVAVAHIVGLARIPGSVDKGFASNPGPAAIRLTGARRLEQTDPRAKGFSNELSRVDESVCESILGPIGEGCEMPVGLRWLDMVAKGIRLVPRQVLVEADHGIEMFPVGSHFDRTGRHVCSPSPSLPLGGPSALPSRPALDVFRLACPRRRVSRKAWAIR